MSKTKQSFSYTGSETYNIDNVVLSSSAIALFDSKTGVGGVDYVPYDGATVTVVAGDALSSYRKLAPTLSNKLYYLVSEVQYTADDAAEILAQATEIPVIYDDGVFRGEFVFSNPNNYENVYLLWDYEDKMATVASFKGATESRSIQMTYTSNIGRAGITFNTVDPDQPTRYQIEWNGEIVADTKYVGLNSSANYDKLIAAGIPAEDIGLVSPYNGTVNNGVGTIDFFKYLADGAANLIVSSPFSTSTWIVSKVDPTLKSFYLSEANGIPSDVCAQCPDTLLYHNGPNALPDVGTTIYSTSNGSTVYSGDEYIHLINTVQCITPPVANLSYISISSNGVVISKSSCTCSEYAVPFILVDEVVVQANANETFFVDVINNPTSWTLNSSSLPSQASFSNGVLSFNNCPPGSYSITVTASNCFGTSNPTVIPITVGTNEDVKPVLVDIEQFKDTAIDATYVIPTFTMLYFKGNGTVPALKDQVFFDPELKRPFVGGLKWYFVNDSSYVMQLDKYGYVTNLYSFISTTTTTTTTTTLPAGTYYEASSCQDPTVVVVLYNSSGTTISTGNIVKTNGDRNCWTILRTTTPTTPYYSVSLPVTIYGSCTACIDATTTTSTTTTTTSTPVTAFEIDTTGFTSAYDACTSTPSYVTYYRSTGSLAVNNFVYTNSGATTLFNGAFLWYLVRVSGTTYACLISDTGQILNVSQCSAVTTTTTTTTLPYYYYNGTKCVGGAAVLMRYQGYAPLSLPNYVKDSNGDCITITSTASSGSQNGDIYYVYGSCSECAATTTTTTTTTTTSTTTSTTTTTTTTTRPTYTQLVLSYSSSQSSVCTDINIGDYYVNGAIGVPGNYIFTDELGADLAPAGWYLNLIINVAYEWDGADWTGATKSC